MKKLLILSAMMLLAGAASGQTLQKGNLLGIHVSTVDLKPGVTMNQYNDYMLTKYIPAFEKAFKGARMFLIKGIRGDMVNKTGVIIYFKSQALRDKYYKADGSNTELGQKAYDEMAPVIDTGNKLGTITTTYTDWIIQ